MVRIGRYRLRTVATAAGLVEVTAPRVIDRRIDEATGEQKRFYSRPPLLGRAGRGGCFLAVDLAEGTEAGAGAVVGADAVQPAS